MLVADEQADQAAPVELFHVISVWNTLPQKAE